jgi:hypothetical protein
MSCMGIRSLLRSALPRSEKHQQAPRVPFGDPCASCICTTPGGELEAVRLGRQVGHDARVQDAVVVDHPQRLAEQPQQREQEGEDLHPAELGHGQRARAELHPPRATRQRT